MYFSAGTKMCCLNKQCHEIFRFRFFHESFSPKPPKITLGSFLFFCENSRRYSKVKVHHRYQRHGWQMVDTISCCWHLKVTLKEKIYLYVNSTTQRCSKKIIKTFLIEDFFICLRCQRHRWRTLSCEYLREFSKKFKTVLMVYSCRGLGETDSWKKPEFENLLTLSL